MSLDFEQNLRKYAELAVKIGVNVQPGQRVMIRASLDNAQLARLIAISAYQADALLEYAQQGDALISIRGNDLDLLKDQDPDLIASARKAASIKFAPFTDLV